jgi:EAL domain-containing protein (putative c-di-GMP-specific phosphodiesterase class I)/GGDEF domain-containing protein
MTESEMLARILHFDLLRAVLQPVFRMSDGTVFGYEGLVRGPEGSPLQSPKQLFDEADRLGLRVELELAAARTVCRHFAQAKVPGYLMVNMSCRAVDRVAAQPDRAVDLITSAGLSPEGVILELTEHDRVVDSVILARSLRTLREHGVALALDDFGSGHSNLQLWMELRPRLVKLDRVFINGLSANGDKFEIARMLKRLAESFGTELVAEGIENESDLAVARDMGIELAQGFMLGLPARIPVQKPEPRAAAVLLSPKLAVLPESSRPPQQFRLAGELSMPIPPVDKTTTNDALANLFLKHPEYHAVAVVDGTTPLALINRRNFIDRVAAPYYKEVYGRKPVTSFGEAAPLMVDRRTPLGSLMKILAGEDQRYLSDGFVVTDNGTYIGLGTGESLVRAVTELRIEAARYANPLTFLPGNIPISQHLQRLLDAAAPFTACYADLNNFKPFNDQYGYWRGDEMIRLAAAVIQDHADPTVDFVGHVGGDDFLVVYQSEDWRRRCEHIVATFNQRAQAFFSPDEAARGWFPGEDRAGLPCTFPLTTISIGVVRVAPNAYRHHEDVAAAAAAAKRQAKAGAEAIVVLGPREVASVRAATEAEARRA